MKPNDSKQQSAKNKKYIGAILGIIIGLTMYFQGPFPGLSIEGTKAVAILCTTVIYWVFDVFPDYIVGLGMSCLFVITKAVPIGTAFAAYSTDTWWLLVAAIGLGAAATKTGLLTRISWMVLKVFPATYRGQVIALIGCGTFLGTLIPSTTAKMAIMSPVALSISNALGFEKKSKGATGIFAACGTGFNLSSPFLMSSSFLAYVMISLLPKEEQGQFTWFYWLMCSATWGIVLLIGCTLAIFLLYKPTEKVSLDSNFINQKIQELGDFTTEQKTTLGVAIACLLLWMTQGVHHVPASIVALIGVCILWARNICTREDFRKLITWDAIVFLGAVTSLGAVFKSLKINTWLGGLFGPVLAPYAQNIYIYLILLSVLVYILRFFVISVGSAVAVLTLVFAPISAAHGINPFITAFTIYCAGNVWNVFYNSIVWVVGYYAAGGDMVEFSEMRKLSIAYMIISIIGLLASVPVWTYLGLL